ncbi:MAG: xanthine dehydrogenase family protein molybdopterin-binding subunit [Synergistaceae bacterium]|nr:xanthine dehydrogenase family protein molybdopterin-binding subunit [Synergistaceae bacterium]
MNYIGKNINRVDAVAKVTGEPIFVADLTFPNMLHAKSLRAGIPHARILSIDTSEAEAMPGVVKVAVGKDRPMLFGACFIDQPPVAVDKVRHAGEPVAVVIAKTAQQAQAALPKIKVEYEPLPYVLDPIKAMEPDAPLVHEDIKKYWYLESSAFPVPNTNIFHHYKLRKGDSAKGFAEADVTVESEFEFPLSSHAALEPHGAICRFGADGQSIEMWASQQGPFILRDVLGGMFKMETSRIRIHSPYLGGGFGGKSDVCMEPLVAWAASFVPGYAVKLILTRQEVFTSSLLGRGMKGWMKIGAKKDGTLTALEAKMYFASGAYADTGFFIFTVGGHNCTGPYEIPNCHVDSYGVYTNSPPVGAFRGYGHPEGEFMSGRLLYMLAKKLGIPQEELMRKNFLAPGRINSVGQVMKEDMGDLPGCLDVVRNAVYKDELPKEDEKYYYGKGFAAMFKSPKHAANAGSTCAIHINNDGCAFVNLAGIEMGQGVYTVFAQMAAEVLQIPIEKVHVNNSVDTQHNPWEWMTVASLQTYRGGRAIQSAASRLLDLGKRNACLVWHCESELVSYANGFYTHKNTGDTLSLGQLARGYMTKTGNTIGEPLQATGWYRVADIEDPDPDTGMGNVASSWTFGAQACSLRIEKTTGKVEILHFASAFDIGKAINPMLVQGQISGGVVQGLGGALMEEILFKDGVVRNTNFSGYHIPRLKDIPKKQSMFILETPNKVGPWSAKPVAEHPIVIVAPVVLNAVADATGVEFTRIPLTPDIILKAISGK